MTYEEVVKYFIPALHNIYGSSAGTARQLEGALGRGEDPTGWGRGYHGPMNNSLPMCEEYKAELAALTGPHAKTMLKIIRIRKGLERSYQP
jgi:hypothetical protein